MQRNRSFGSRESGFTLVEVALVVVIGGLMLALFGDSLTNMIKESKVRTTETRLAEISDALRRYSSYNSMLPCPASRTLATSDVNYGLPAGTGVCNTATVPAGTVRDATTATEEVRIGMVPTRTLNLPDDYGYDAWGSRFIYAVTESMTDTATYDAQNSAVEITGNPTPAAFVVVSVGKDKEGGYSVAGGAGPACNAMGSQIDIENCDDDRTFTNALQSSADNANYYDDYISFKNLDTMVSDIPEGAIVAFRLESCPKGWAALPAVEGRVIVGQGELDTTLTSPANPTSTATVSYSGATYARPDPDSLTPPDMGGWASRIDSDPIPGTKREYPNMPPYVAYLYCVKTGSNYAYAMATSASSGTPSSSSGTPSSGTPSSSTTSSSTTSSSTTSSTSSGKSSGGKTSSSGGGRVLCTYFVNRRRLSQGLLDMEREHTRLFIHPATMRGYHVWAVPLVRLLQEGKCPSWLEEAIYKITMWRVAEIAYQMGRTSKPNYLGKLARLIGEPICFLIGLVAPEQNWRSLETAYARKE